MSIRHAAVALAAAIPLAACAVTAQSAPQAPQHPAPASSAQPANPRPVFARTGAVYDSTDGTAVNRDIYGDKFLCGVIRGTQERICVYTFGSAARQREDLAQPGSGDGEVTVRGSLWDVWVIPATDANGNFTFPVTPAQVAARTGGTVVTSQ